VVENGDEKDNDESMIQETADAAAEEAVALAEEPSEVADAVGEAAEAVPNEDIVASEEESQRAEENNDQPVEGDLPGQINNQSVTIRSAPTLLVKKYSTM
jgi:hypothetical protein